MELVAYIDLDGTLAVSPISGIIEEAYRQISLRAGRELGEVKLLSWRIHVELIKKSSPLAFDWDYIYEEVSKILQISPSSRIDRRLEELCEFSKVLDDAYRVLDRLRSTAGVLVLATNGLLKYQKCVIEFLGLDRYFDLVLTPDVAGCLKNCSKFYSLPSTSSRKVVIGDNYTFDVYYPKTFGLKTVYVDRSTIDPYVKWLGIERIIEPDTVINSLEQLPNVISRL
ncbi:MAG: HAD family hydrolase [Sulfolobales archaeon]|nr:HAD family hydrolase [Sulfolobales archaeon]MDW8083146.1 HAD family hydrolase [Sulfolobales archaeon]